jgi:hypothetical protein
MREQLTATDLLGKAHLFSFRHEADLIHHWLSFERLPIHITDGK